MTHTHLMSDGQLAALMGSAAEVVVLDCSSDLAAPDAGRAAYQESHIPSAQYVSMKDALSGPANGRNGRNPLPDVDTFRRAMGELGISDNTQVVAYDNGDGVYACRLWWMLRWVGHSAVAVLDGGLGAWRSAGRPLSHTAATAPAPGTLSARASLAMPIAYPDLRAGLKGRQHFIIDARPAARFAGENETLDARGGHIPGARNRWFKHNLAADGRFKSPELLRTEFAALLGATASADVVNQCGSGVSACHNLLAMELAGLTGSRLYVGSWSEWAAHETAPIAQGPG